MGTCLVAYNALTKGESVHTRHCQIILHSYHEIVIDTRHTPDVYIERIKSLIQLAYIVET